MTTITDHASRSAEIRAGLPHPVIDADGHWLFPMPVFRDFLRDAGGPDANAMLDDWFATEAPYFFGAPLRWVSVNNPRDWATSQLPGLFADRLDEFGMDVSLVYPTSPGFYVSKPELRRAYARAYNTMTAELFAPYADRLVPVAMIPTHTPEEAVEELDFVTGELGFKVCVINGTIRRPWGPGVDPKGTLAPGQASFIDSLALDSPYDYEPLWQRFEELGLAITTHGGSMGWDNRLSLSNYSFNHLGHFAQANQTIARALYMAGVTFRHPDLRFLFLEGGVGWAANLLADLIGHWEKRSREAMLEHFAPTGLPKEEVKALYRQYGATTFKDHLETMCGDDMLSAMAPGMTLEALTEREQDFDFDHVPAATPTALRESFARSFAFGCEADDPMTKLAFDTGVTKVRLRAVLGSDISHWDVLDMSDVLHEAYELVEDGDIDEAAFRELVFANAVYVHGAKPFAGTRVEADVAAELA